MELQFSNKTRSTLYQTMLRHTTFMPCILLKKLKSYSINGILIHLMLALLLFTNYASAQQQSAEGRRASSARPVVKQWITYPGPDKDFRIDFPVEPKFDEYLYKGNAGSPGTIARRYSVFTNTMMLALGFQSLDYAPNSPFANRIAPTYEKKIKAAARQREWKIIKMQRLSNSTVELEVWERNRVPSGYVHSISRTIVRNGQIYDLHCRSRYIAQEIDRTVCRRFFNSFRIIGPPQ